METSKQYKAHVFGDNRIGDAVERIGNTPIFGKIQFYDAEADTKAELIDNLAKHFETDSDNFLANFFEYNPGSGDYEAGEISYPIELRYNGEPLSLSENNASEDAQ
ncbi:hypothetical protein [Weissella cibaria]|uniref:hypothetical protein n=1 Tax=Weissella cibaria TaxID=137591 RepID=UPI0016803DCB|nr:hypothetical protein [Weissella cibaria]MBD1503154.1 hypothetical protein [Weissella cibaria]